MEKWQCTVCGFIYDQEVGDEENEVEPGTPFHDLPDDWICPECDDDKSYFEKMPELQ